MHQDNRWNRRDNKRRRRMGVDGAGTKNSLRIIGERAAKARRRQEKVCP